MNSLARDATAVSLPTNLPLDFSDVQAAARRIEGAVVRTQTVYSAKLSALTGANVWLKFENRQYTAAYKERGALNKLLTLGGGASVNGVIAASAGNHAQGLAYHGGRLGIPVTIVMPKSTPIVKVNQTRALGATVVLEGASFEDAYAHARQLETERGMTFVHPFDDPAIMAGQGTVALEMLQDVPQLDTIVVPVGGGGLIAGVAVTAKAMNPDVRIVGVQSNLYSPMYALKLGKEFTGGGDTLAEGIAVKEPGALTRTVVMALVDEMRIVKEVRIEEAIYLMLDLEKTVVEGAGAVGLATLLPPKSGTFRPEFRDRNVGIILSGGNIDLRFLANVILRNLARSGRIGRIGILLDDKAGSLHELTGIFSRHGANIIEVSHQRIFGVLSAKSIQTEIEYEIRSEEARDELLQDIAEAGYAFEVITISGRRGGRSLRH